MLQITKEFVECYQNVSDRYFFIDVFSKCCRDPQINLFLTPEFYPLFEIRTQINGIDFIYEKADKNFVDNLSIDFDHQNNVFILEVQRKTCSGKKCK
jgi:hypothetical protein